MVTIKKYGIFLTILFTAVVAHSQTAKVYTEQQLREMGQQLRQREDKVTGLASETLETYENRHTMLAVRDKDGQAELHEVFADVIFVIDGEATLVTGGTVLNPRSTAPGETVGTSVQGGQRTSIGKGSVIQIPPHIPHQLLLSGGKTLLYFVIKVQEDAVKK